MDNLPLLPSLIVKRSIVLNGHKTSVSVEEAFWKELKLEAIELNVTLGHLVDRIDQARRHGNLSSACRCHVLAHIREQLDACRKKPEYRTTP